MPCALLLRRHLVDEGGAGHHPDDRQGDDESREHPRRPPLAPPPCVQRAGRRQELGLPRSERHTASGQVRLGLRERRPGEQQVLRLALGSPLLRPSLEGRLVVSAPRGVVAADRLDQPVVCELVPGGLPPGLPTHQVGIDEVPSSTTRLISSGPSVTLYFSTSCPRRPCGVISLSSNQSRITASLGIPLASAILSCTRSA